MSKLKKELAARQAKVDPKATEQEAVVGGKKVILRIKR